MIDNNRPAVQALRELLAFTGENEEEILEQVSVGSIGWAVALEELGYVPDWKNRGKAIYRGRTILKAAYPNYPTDRYSNSYIENMMVVLPKIFLRRGEFHFNARPDKHLSRLDLWLKGASRRQMAEMEGISYEAVHTWPTKNFPGILKRTVSFYDIDHGAELLENVHWSERR